VERTARLSARPASRAVRLPAGTRAAAPAPERRAGPWAARASVGVSTATTLVRTKQRAATTAASSCSEPGGCCSCRTRHSPFRKLTKSRCRPSWPNRAAHLLWAGAVM